MRYERLRVLLVDDNHHMRALLAEVLRAIGVREIHEAGDGVEGMQMLRDHPVDVVMTDLSMPAMDGLEFVRLIRSSADSPNLMVPVIVVSGRSTAKAVLETRDAGANEFLAKPITARGVIDRIHQVVEHARPYVKIEGYFGPDRRRRQDPAHAAPWRRAGDEALPKAAAAEG
ncbi:response regulator [Phenylobacterium hankyongense]|uniref:Response regulator n=1 Tax=Phenylobacterium hankyongense TaxID=1813876 RepID=A0A328AUJ1_9CAUL|nr:response regulator [Phenylobacterium hankyongense]RAK58812.1 response regulator [Phenylobacterium hankyongense]